MASGINLLNQVQRKIIDFANENNIDLRTQFKTVEKFKEFVIAFTIKSLVDIGMEINKAYDLVMGDGKYEELANSVWQTLSAADKGGR